MRSASGGPLSRGASEAWDAVLRGDRAQGAAKVTEIHELAEADRVTLRLARVKPQVLAVLEADGIVERIGTDHIHGNVHFGVEAQLADADR